jgi:hypothetical protein
MSETNLIYHSSTIPLEKKIHRPIRYIAMLPITRETLTPRLIQVIAMQETCSCLVQMNVKARSPREHDLPTAHRTQAAISLYVTRTGKERGIPKYFKTPLTTKEMLNAQTFIVTYMCNSCVSHPIDTE